MQTTGSISVKAACRVSNAYPQYLYHLIAIGKLLADKDSNGNWAISLPSFEKWLESRRKRIPALAS